MIQIPDTGHSFRFTHIDLNSNVIFNISELCYKFKQYDKKKRKYLVTIFPLMFLIIISL